VVVSGELEAGRIAYKAGDGDEHEVSSGPDVEVVWGYAEF